MCEHSKAAIITVRSGIAKAKSRPTAGTFERMREANLSLVWVEERQSQCNFIGLLTLSKDLQQDIQGCDRAPARLRS
jgi:hypothetical protein